MGIRWQAEPGESEPGQALVVGTIGQAWRVSARVGVHSRDRGILDLRIEPADGMAPGGLLTSDLRAVDLLGAVKAARVALARPLPKPGPGLIRRLTTANGAEIPESERRSASLSRLERLAMVALDYDQCLAQGRTDSNAYIRELWGVGVAQAREWIRAARRAGLLGGTSPGRAGGALDWTRWREIFPGNWVVVHPAVRG